MNKQQKVIVVTGAGQGIGKEIAKIFSEKDYFVAAVDINKENVIETAEKLGENVDYYICDVSKKKEVNSTFHKIQEKYGAINVLINNAGILMRGFIEDFTPGELQKILDVNLFGVYNCCRAAIKIMKKQKKGLIINSTSVVNKQYDVGMAGYCISKKSVEVLTKILAAEVAPYGIRVNAYSPGTTETPMTAHLIKSRGDTKVKQIPSGRFGHPRDIAETCYFLASDSAEHINGAVIEIDGGELIVQRPEKAYTRTLKRNGK